MTEPVRISIELTTSGQLNFSAPMETQEQKNIVYAMLAQALMMVTNYEPKTVVVAGAQLLNGIALTHKR